jgi:hypothetical protein
LRRRNSVPLTGKGYRLGGGDAAGKGQMSETIMVHWSCPIPTRPRFLLVRPAVAAIVSGNVAVPQCAAVAGTSGRAASPLPYWDRQRRELWVGRFLVKRFRQPSPSQEAALSAFQAANWHPIIADPLPRDPAQDPKRRLHQTICNLNRGHRKKLIRFAGDGTGRGITWRHVSGQTRKKRQAKRRQIDNRATAERSHSDTRAKVALFSDF